MYKLPDWEATEVNDSLWRVSNYGYPSAPQEGYDPTKRGYPDISALANKYQVVANGVIYSGKSSHKTLVFTKLFFPYRRVTFAS